MSLKQTSRWYETCGESFFTQLIVPFLSNPSRELKSLSLTCRFIYQIYSSSSLNSSNLWMNLLLNKYPADNLNRELLENFHNNNNGKLINLYYQLIYYEQHHLDKALSEFLISSSPTLLKTTMANNHVGPRFICASSYGLYYSMGFVNMLLYSDFDLEFDPCLEDDYTYQLLESKISLYPISVMDEYVSYFKGYIDKSEGMIFTLVIKSDFTNIESVLDEFDLFYKQVELHNRLTSFLFTIGISFKDVVEDSFKTMVEEKLKRHISENYKIIYYLIMEFNPRKKDDVWRITVESLKRVQFVNAKLFLKYYQSIVEKEEKNKKKKNCSVM